MDASADRILPAKERRSARRPSVDVETKVAGERDRAHQPAGAAGRIDAGIRQIGRAQSLPLLARTPNDFDRLLREKISASSPERNEAILGLPAHGSRLPEARLTNRYGQSGRRLPPGERQSPAPRSPRKERPGLSQKFVRAGPCPLSRAAGKSGNPGPGRDR